MPRRALLLLALFVCAQAAARPASEFGRRYALLIGVQDYTGSEFDSLKYSENDVNELANVFRDDKYDGVTVMSVTRGKRNAALHPTAGNIKAQLTSVLGKCVPGDTVVVAYAGHGVALRGGEDDELYLCPAGASLVRPNETLVSLTYLVRSLKSSQAFARVLIVDACRNKKPLLSRTSLVDNLKSATRPAVRRPAEGVAVLFSCSEGEVARESNVHKHGFFFFHLLDGLRRWARGESGEVGVERLYDHVATRMAGKLKEEYGPDAVQTPDYRREVKFGVLHVLRGRLTVPPSPTVVVAKPKPAPDPPARPPEQDPERDVDLGYRMRLARRYPEAIEAFTRALAAKPDHPLALIRRGACYYEQRKDRARALADIERAIRAHPDFALGYYNRAGIRFEADDLDGALDDYNQAIRLDEHYAPAYANRGNVYRARGALNRAEADYDRSIALDATSPHAFCGRGAVMYKRSRFAESLAAYESAAAADPRSAIAHAGRGDALNALARYREAAVAYECAIPLDPNNAQLRRALAFVRERIGLRP